MQDSKIPLAKKGQREVTAFVGHELLYDYLVGALDDDRRKSIEDHVKFSRDAQLDLLKIERGLQYAESLSNTTVSQPILDHLSKQSSYLSVLIEKTQFQRWPSGVKWGIEALTVISVIMFMLVVAPWDRLVDIGAAGNNEQIILAEVSRPDEVSDQEIANNGDSTKGEFADEDIKQDIAESATAKPAPTEPTKNLPTQAKNSATPTPAKPATNAVKPTVPAKEDAQQKIGGGGFLYRGEIAVSNLDMVGPKIRDKILEFGGRKAGDVELGWKRTSNSAYFHFTIPEAKYAELNAFLATYGKPKINKEKHPRVMPDGIVRLIIIVEEARQ